MIFGIFQNVCFVGDEKPPASPCPRDPAASFPSSCPWYSLVDLLGYYGDLRRRRKVTDCGVSPAPIYTGILTVGKTRNSCFSLKAVILVLFLKAAHIDRLAPGKIELAWICHSHYSPLLRGEGMERWIMSRVNLHLSFIS